MKKLLLLAVCLIGVGFWRGWFTFSSAPASPGGNQENFELSINRDKIKADAAALEKDAADLAARATNPTK